MHSHMCTEPPLCGLTNPKARTHSCSSLGCRQHKCPLSTPTISLLCYAVSSNLQHSVAVIQTPAQPPAKLGLLTSPSLVSICKAPSPPPPLPPSSSLTSSLSACRIRATSPRSGVRFSTTGCSSRQFYTISISILQHAWLHPQQLAPKLLTPTPTSKSI